tara:strand:+ start:669 stop:899 length:231 start_codon:yes stop_codon:yes gene_type:complete
MRINSKGQVTIPRNIREKTGLKPGTEVELVVEQDAVRLFPAKTRPNRRNVKLAIARLRNSATVSIATDDAMTLTRG